jgi:hypothetical protein
MEKSNKPKIALVNTPLIAGVAHHPPFPPLGLAYLAAVLDQDGYEVKIMDCPVCEIDHKKLKTDLAAFVCGKRSLP